MQEKAAGSCTKKASPASRGEVTAEKDALAANPLATLGQAGRPQAAPAASCCGALVVYRIGAHIPVPGIDPASSRELFKQQQGGILDMFNMFSGGALSRFTIFALGIMPYISASIIMQLMTVVSPTLEALKKEGEAGRRKITQYTRYGTVVLALFQALGIAIALESQPRPGDRPGHGVPPHDRDHAHDRHDVPHVAGRADHRARHRQRHLDDHLRRHRGGPAARDRRHARAGAHRRDHPSSTAIVIFVAGGAASRRSSCFVERGQRKILVNYAKRQVGQQGLRRPELRTCR